MSLSTRRHAGFTLIELMIVVAILGALASVAIPAFNTYLRRSRSAEATEFLKNIFSLAASYYLPEHAEFGMNGATHGACVVGSAQNGITPNGTKQAGIYTDPAWGSLDFAIGFTYYRYEIETVGGARCDVPRSTVPLYYFRARGDLDGDTVSSLFELAAGSNADNSLYHSRGFYVHAETE